MMTKSYAPIRKDDTDVFGTSLYETVKKHVRREAKRFWPTLSRQDVEDLVHDSYTTILEHREKADMNRNFDGWVYRICRNKVLQDAKHKSRRVGRFVHLEQDLDDDAPGLDCSRFLADSTYEADCAITSREFECKFWRCIQKLDPEQKSIAFMLMEDIPYSEMAQMLHCSVNAVRTKVCRTRQALFRLGIAA